MNADYIWKLSKFGRLTSTRLRFDDDFADRLNYQFTGLLLFVFVGIIGIRQYVGKPIHCWTPQEFTRSWEEFAENYCWVASTYFAKYNTLPGEVPPPIFYRGSINSQAAHPLPTGYHQSPSSFLLPSLDPGNPGEKLPAGRLISYYQWAPILLAVQSFMFYCPCLVWRLFAQQSGFHLRRIMQLASEAALAAPAEAETFSSTLTGQEAVKTSCQKSSQCVINAAQQGGKHEVLQFTTAKSIRSLARYLEMCLLRQKQRRLASYYKTKISKFTPYHSAASFSPAAFKQYGYAVNTKCFAKKNQNHFPMPSSQRILSSNTMQSAPANTHIISKFPTVKYQRETYKNGYTKCFCESCYTHTEPASSEEKGTVCSQICECIGRRISYQKASKWHSHKTFQPTACIKNVYGSHNSDRMYDTKHNTEGARVHKNGTEMKNSRQTTLRHRKQCNPCGNHRGNCLVRLHLLVKFLYLFNAIGQIYLLGYYTGVSDYFYGVRVLYDLAIGKQWKESGHFPRVTFCHFEARKLAHSHYYTLQCVLPINMFLEKIYIFLWLWIFIVGLINLVSVVAWIHRMSTGQQRFSWIQHQLLTIGQFNRSVWCIKSFVESHLGPDGVFILRLIAINYGDLVAGDAIGDLWTSYLSRSDICSSPVNGINHGLKEQLKENAELSDAANMYTNKYLLVKLPRGHRSSESFNQRVETVYHSNSEFDENSPLHKNNRKNQRWTPAGYPATMLATEVIHPSDRFVMPFLSPNRRPLSVHSKESSGDTRDSRDRACSASPPPIPQRLSYDIEPSLGEQCPVMEMEGRKASYSVGSGHTNSRSAGEERDTVGYADEAGNDRERCTAGDMNAHLNEYKSYDDRCPDDFQVDENIV